MILNRRGREKGPDSCGSMRITRIEYRLRAGLEAFSLGPYWAVGTLNPLVAWDASDVPGHVS